MQVQKALKDSESHALALINAIPDMMFRLDRQGVFVDFKAAREDLYYQPESIIGKKLYDILPPELAGLIETKINLTLQTGQIQVFEYQLQLPSKGIGYYEARMVPCSTHDILTIVRDITYGKRAEAEIHQKSKQLEKINAEKDKFFSIIAHDLKSPFNSIIGLSEILVDQVNDRDYKGIDKFAKIIYQSSNRAMDLLANLMEWSQAQTGRLAFLPEKFAISSLIEDVVAAFDIICRQKEVFLRANIDADIDVFADRQMMSTVLRNLLSNAVKFSLRLSQGEDSG